MTYFRRVILESPFAGDVERNKKYLSLCIRDSILNYKDSPFASHRMFTEALDDNLKCEREIGMVAGFSWHGSADAVVVYGDFGITEGMCRGIENADELYLPVEHRKLPKYLMDEMYK